jgi:hypothetical protein
VRLFKKSSNNFQLKKLPVWRLFVHLQKTIAEQDLKAKQNYWIKVRDFTFLISAPLMEQSIAEVKEN